MPIPKQVDGTAAPGLAGKANYLVNVNGGMQVKRNALSLSRIPPTALRMSSSSDSLLFIP